MCSFAGESAVRAGNLAASFVFATSFLAVETGFAMEPTPLSTANDSPAVTTNTETPAATRIIVKYVDAEAWRVESQETARDSVKMLSEIAGAELRHIRLMSGNAQVVEVVGITDLKCMQVQEKIESIIRRIEADPAVDYAEPDAMMQIQ